MRALHADGEGLHAVDHEVEAGLARVPLLDIGERAVELRTVPRRQGVFHGQVGAWRQLSAPGGQQKGQARERPYRQGSAQGAGSNSIVPPSAISDRNSRLSLMR